MKYKIKQFLLYAMALILTLEVIASIEIKRQNEAKESEQLQQVLIEKIKEMAACNNDQKQIINELGSTIESMNIQISSLQMQMDGKADKPSRGGDRGKKEIMEVTAYDLSYPSCGKYPDHPEYGITASGKRVKEWCTIAAGKSIPFGTQIYIPFFADKPNNGIFTVQDRGSAIRDNCIDVYMADNSACMEFGRRQLEVYILTDEVRS